MSHGFSPETIKEKRKASKNYCTLLKVEVDVLEGHHCIPQVLSGSNNPHNCVMLAGYNAYSVYGLPVQDVHEEVDQKSLHQRLFLHPDTLQFVPMDQMPDDCFRDEKEKVIYKLQEKDKNKEKKKKRKIKKKDKEYKLKRLVLIEEMI